MWYCQRLFFCHSCTRFHSDKKISHPQKFSTNGDVESLTVIEFDAFCHTIMQTICPCMNLKGLSGENREPLAQHDPERSPKSESGSIPQRICWYQEPDITYYLPIHIETHVSMGHTVRRHGYGHCKSISESVSGCFGHIGLYSQTLGSFLLALPQSTGWTELLDAVVLSISHIYVS